VTLRFDFETRRASCLLLYADDGGGREFVAVRLVRGTARLRLGGAGQAPGPSSPSPGRALTVGSGLDDGRTHSVRVDLAPQLATLAVDRASQTLPLDLPPRSAATEFAPVYVGGLPAEFRSGQRLDELAAPSAAFEPAFVGSVRNVAYATRCGADADVVRMMSGIPVSVFVSEVWCRSTSLQGGDLEIVWMMSGSGVWSSGVTWRSSG